MCAEWKKIRFLETLPDWVSFMFSLFPKVGAQYSRYAISSTTTVRPDTRGRRRQWRESGVAFVVVYTFYELLCHIDSHNYALFTMFVLRVCSRNVVLCHMNVVFFVVVEIS
jgi:hypothetical protein